MKPSPGVDTIHEMDASAGRRNETGPASPRLVVAKTRIPPPRTGFVRRDNLISLLTDGGDRKVTVVQAPAGYGKSTLLMQWAEADPMRRFTWLSLDQEDNDPTVLWGYILFALRALSPGLADKAWGLLRTPQPDLDEVLAETLNSLLDIPGRIVLVLDDYHAITNPKCHESMQYFIDHLPRSIQVAFGTRSRPPLSLSRINAGGGLVVVEATALQFSLEETKQALQHAGLRPGTEEVASVHERTEGWPAGVYLLAVSGTAPARHGEPSATVGAVDAYLREQMLGHLPGEERLELAQWSILQHLNGDLCDRVSDRTDSATRLERLSRTNLLLMPIDSNREWYRFHDLLRDALHREFTRIPAEQRRTIHLRAAEWWGEKDNMPRFIHHCMEAADYERASKLICANWLEYMLTGRRATLREWIDRIPGDALLAYPPMLVASAWISAFSGDVKVTHRFAVAAREGSFDGAMPDGSASYVSAVAMLQAALGHHGMKDANAHAELAFRLESQESQWRQLAAALVGVTRFGLGKYEDARLALGEAARIPSAPDGVGTYARGQLALMEMHAGRWDEGSRQADIACALIEESNLGNLLSSGAALVAAAAAAAHIGNRGLAFQRLRSLAPIQKVLSDAIPFDAFQTHLVAAETYLLLGDYSAASVHARSASSRLETFGDAGIFEERLTQVQTTLGSSSESAPASGTEPDDLTDRELQILTLLQSALSLRDIGSELFVSRNTAKSHVASVYRKLGVTSRTAAVARAHQLDLI